MKTLYKEYGDVSFPKNLGFSLYTILFVSHVVITSGNGMKFKVNEY